MTSHLHLGQTVRNSGIIAKVAGFHKISGDPILRPLWNDGTKWIADAAKCEPLDEKPAVYFAHREGLVQIG